MVIKGGVCLHRFLALDREQFVDSVVERIHRGELLNLERLAAALLGVGRAVPIRLDAPTTQQRKLVSPSGPAFGLALRSKCFDLRS